MRVLITGGCGLVGHHLVEHLLKNTDCEIVVWDKLTYAASGFDRLRDIQCFDTGRVSALTVDFAVPIAPGASKETGGVDYVLHLGAETHVDNSIADPELFVRTNVLGTMHMLQYARTLPDLKGFLYFSTDEVYGPAPGTKLHKEWDRHKPANPYAAAKAGGELLTIAWGNTHGLPVVVSNTMNIFGERQHPEKFIPMVIRKVLRGESVTIHADRTKTKAGTRFYIHARNVADAVWYLVENVDFTGECQKFNIVGEKEVDNLEMARFIAGVVGKPLKYEMVKSHSSRPGHDLRYGLSGQKLKEMGWSPPAGFEASLEKTIQWTLDNPRWLSQEGWLCKHT